MTKLLDPYVNTQTSLEFTNVPNGTYNLVVFGIAEPIWTIPGALSSRSME